jgi:hypothetical protein
VAAHNPRGMASLEASKDLTLVEVSEPEEHVLVKKVGSEIALDLQDAGENIHMSVPIRALSQAIEEIA